MSIDYEEFGPYAVYECLGTGGMATVHRAVYDDGELVREVALKRLLPQHADDKTFVDDFVREGKLAARLSHASIVRIFEQGRIDRTHFIAMELVVGHPLMHLIRAAHHARKQTPIGIVIALVSELCDALDYACNAVDHETGERFNIVHRDLSPSNLLVTDDGHLKLIDFGVAKATTGKRFTTESGLVKGKLGYMSVEALAGKPVDGRSDVFSVGVVAWELITGRRLFTGKTELDVIQRVRDGSVVPPSTFNPACPPTLDAIVLQALARAREDRWPTAGAMRQAIELLRRAYREEATSDQVVAWREGLAPAVTPAPPPPPAIAPAGKRRADSESEMTEHHRVPPVAHVRQHTMIDLFEDEPAELELSELTPPPPASPSPSPSPSSGSRPKPAPTTPMPPRNMFPEDEGVRTVQAAAAYPGSEFKEIPTKAYDDPADTYMEMSVSRAEQTGIQLGPFTSPAVARVTGTQPIALAPLSQVPTTTTQTAPVTLDHTIEQSATSITALTVSPPPSASMEMLQLDDTGDDTGDDLLDLEEPPGDGLLDLDGLEPPIDDPDPPEVPEPPPSFGHDTIVVKRGG